MWVLAALAPSCVAFAMPGEHLVVSNVNVQLRTSSGPVDVYYNLQTIGGEPVAVSLSLSTDAGLTYTHPCQSVTGDVGPGVTPGNNLHIVWDVTTDYPGLYSDRCRLRIYVDDGVPGSDLVTVVFTTQDPAHIVYPTSATHGDSLRIQDLQAAVASADAVYRLGTGYDIASFAYSELDHVAANGYKDPSGLQCGLTSDGGEIRNNVRYLNLRFPQATRRAEMFYIPWENYIPQGSTIVSAMLNVEHSQNNYMAYTDTLVAVQMSNPSDNDWYKIKGVGSNYTDYAHASWSLQQSANGGAWGGPEGHPWVPALDDRKNLWSWGAINDWTGSTTALSPGYLPSRTNMQIKLTNCVQSVVAGGVNNGILLAYGENFLGGGNFKHYHWDDSGSAAGRTPYVVVTYRTAQYTPPFGTSDWAFMANTDDGKFACNAAYTDTFLAHGGKFTIFMAKRQINSGSGACTPAQLVNFHTKGMEVGNHSRYHKDPWGLTHWSHEYTMPDTASAAWDSLKFDVQPKWMYAMADTIVGDLRGSPRFAKSFALPNNRWSPEVMLALEKYGYTAIRTGTSFTYNRDTYYQLATQSPGRTDSLMTGVPTQFARRARNMSGLPTFQSIDIIAGYKSNPALTEASLDSIRTNMHRAVFQLRGQDRRALNLYWHDFKTNPSNNSYSDGVNANELGAMLDVVDALGGRYMTTGEYTEWIKSKATAVPTPFNYAQPDTFRVEASERVWFIPDE
jgi:hypothetical protein